MSSFRRLLNPTTKRNSGELKLNPEMMSIYKYQYKTGPEKGRGQNTDKLMNCTLREPFKFSVIPASIKTLILAQFTRSSEMTSMGQWRATVQPIFFITWSHTLQPIIYCSGTSAGTEPFMFDWISNWECWTPRGKNLSLTNIVKSMFTNNRRIFKLRGSHLQIRLVSSNIISYFPLSQTLKKLFIS